MDVTLLFFYTEGVKFQKDVQIHLQKKQARELIKYNVDGISTPRKHIRT